MNLEPTDPQSKIDLIPRIRPFEPGGFLKRAIGLGRGLRVAFPPAEHAHVHEKLLRGFVMRPALRRWRALVCAPVLHGRADRPDVVTWLDVTVHPLIPRLIGWLATTSRDEDDGVPPPFDGTDAAPWWTPSVAPADRYAYGPIDADACWSRLAATTAGAVLASCGFARCAAAPGGLRARLGTADVDALEADRVACVRRRMAAPGRGGPWFTYREMADALAWETPVAKATQLVPLLAQGLRGVRPADAPPDAVPGGWCVRRGGTGRSYHWPACCGDMRRAQASA